MERRWEAREAGRRYDRIVRPGGVGNVRGGGGGEERKGSSESEGSERSGGVKEKEKEGLVDGLPGARQGQRRREGARPWRITQDAPRAGLHVVVAGVGYLL